MALPKQADQSSSTSNSNFCLLMAKHVLGKEAAKGSNALISPFSFNILLSLIAAGSRGCTLEQLLFLLGSKSIENLNLLASQMMALASPTKESKGPIVSLVNGTLVSKDLKFKPSFQVNEADQTVAEVSAWTENATRGVMKILQPAKGTLKCVDEDRALVLANEIYFKGKWDHSFDASKTENRDFHLFNGETVQVPFMTGEKFKRYPYGSFDGYKILKLSYENGEATRQFAMYYFLPKARDGLESLIQNFEANPGFFSKQFYLPKEKISNFWIPRFNLSYQFEASETMKELGLNLPFEDRNELTETVNSDKPIYVQKMFHKSLIEVNEEGAEAEADSADLLQLECSRYPVPSFVADHPFMLMIRKRHLGLFFFVGAVLNPLLDS